MKPIFQKSAASGKNASSSMLLMIVAHAYETVTIYQTTMRLNSTDCSATTSWHKIISRPNSKSSTVTAACITTITAAASELLHHLKQNGRWGGEPGSVLFVYSNTKYFIKHKHNRSVCNSPISSSTQKAKCATWPCLTCWISSNYIWAQLRLLQLKWFKISLKKKINWQFHYTDRDQRIP